MSTDELLTIALMAAKTSGDILLSGFGSAVSHESKEGRHNLVTEFDHRSEANIINVLRSHTPDATIITEESGHHTGKNNLVWVVDPLDGTVNFAHGIPLFCVSIAAVVDGQIVCGVVHQPQLAETFTGQIGRGSFCNGRRMQVSATPRLEDSILVTGFPYNVHENPRNCIGQFAQIVGKGLPVRRLGSAALDLAYVADGRFDGYWEVALHAWDMAAGVLLVTEAGGCVTHYHGRPFTLGHDSIIATNGHIHTDLTAALEVDA